MKLSAQGRSATGQETSPQPGRPGLARPLESLVFLLPLILFFQFSPFYSEPAWATNAPDRVVAFQLLRTFFELFGPTGQWMPGLAVVAILLGAQLTSRRPWTIRPLAVGLLYLESIVWALPLIALSRTLRMIGSAQPGSAADRLWSELVLCVGAGIYEELIFRLILICVLVMIGHDLLKWSAGWTLALAVLISSVLFAAHHHAPMGSEPFHAARFFFRFLAGVYLGGVFAFRGYGPAAGAHVAYNLIVVGLTR